MVATPCLLVQRTSHGRATKPTAPYGKPSNLKDGSSAFDVPANDVLNPVCGVRDIFVFPDAHDRPTLFFQQRIGVSIAPLVGLNLIPPPFGVVLRPSSVFGAAVPKTAINEHRHSRRWEKHVDCAPKRTRYPAMEPKSETSPV